MAGTGPYMAESVSDTEITLVKNEHYWNGTPKVDRVIVRSITDGDTLTMALQSGEIDATYGLPYASYPLFENENYQISSCATSRVFFAQMNFDSPVLQDEKVREAIAMGINKEDFVAVLLDGHGEAAAGAFPDNFSFGNETVNAPAYDPEGARALLAEAGWTDTDGDGYADRDGEPLTIRWLTYPGRQELPLLAQSAQATLGEIGIRVEINSTASHHQYLESGEFDIYASALVTAPTGDPNTFLPPAAWTLPRKTRGTITATGWRSWQRRSIRLLTRENGRAWRRRCSSRSWMTTLIFLLPTFR